MSVRVAGDTDWEVYEVTVDKPEVAGSEDTLGDWSLELTELLPGTLYQVTVASRNTFGITQPGKPFTFSTKEPGSMLNGARGYIVCRNPGFLSKALKLTIM